MLRRIDGSTQTGVFISNNSRPRLISNEIWGSGRTGVNINDGGDPFLSRNIIRDHAGQGVLVEHTSNGLANILPDNVFLRNVGGDVVREQAPLPEDDEESDEENEDNDEDDG